MQTIQQGSAAGSADMGVGDHANSNDRADESLARIADMPPPPPPPKRWVPSRKAEIVAAVRGGFLSLDDALERYGLSIEEYLTWQHGVDLFGQAGLRVNRTQQLRRVRARSTER
jgi:hypothetical protein